MMITRIVGPKSLCHSDIRTKSEDDVAENGNSGNGTNDLLKSSDIVDTMPQKIPRFAVNETKSLHPAPKTMLKTTKEHVRKLEA